MWSLSWAILGNKSLLVGQDIPATQITESDWWEEHDVVLSLAKGENMALLRVACTPAQHNSGRGVLDSRTTLWASWVVETRMRPVEQDDSSAKRIAVYFAGCAVFKLFHCVS